MPEPGYFKDRFSGCHTGAEIQARINRLSVLEGKDLREEQNLYLEWRRKCDPSLIPISSPECH